MIYAFNWTNMKNSGDHNAFACIWVNFLTFSNFHYKIRLVPTKSFGQFIKNHGIKISREFPGMQFDSRE